MELDSLEYDYQSPEIPEGGNRGERPRSSYFAAGTIVEGTLHADKDVEIAGQFRGELVSEGTVTLRANSASTISAKEVKLVGAALTGDITAERSVDVDINSSVSGNIRTGNLSIRGKVRGNLHASSLTLSMRAEVMGDVKTSEMMMERGSKITGKVSMGNK